MDHFFVLLYFGNNSQCSVLIMSHVVSNMSLFFVISMIETIFALSTCNFSKNKIKMPFL